MTQGYFGLLAAVVVGFAALSAAGIYLYGPPSALQVVGLERQPNASVFQRLKILELRMDQLSAHVGPHPIPSHPQDTAALVTHASAQPETLPTTPPTTVAPSILTAQPTEHPTAQPTVAVKLDPTVIEGAVRVGAKTVTDRTPEDMEIAERAERMIMQNFVRGREEPRAKFFQGSKLISCLFSVMKVAGPDIPVWVTHGTSLAVLRGQSSPWDGDADVAFLAPDQSKLNEIWKPANMVRWKEQFPVCSKIDAHFVKLPPHLASALPEPDAMQFRELIDQETKQGLDMWDFKPFLDGSDVEASARLWSDRLNLTKGRHERLLCKWICLKETDVFPLKPCQLNVPVGDTDYGLVSRVEQVEAMCGNNFNRRFADLYPPYQNWQIHTPYNFYNQTTHRWEYDIQIWRDFMKGASDQYVYDINLSNKLHVADLLAKVQTQPTPPSNLTVYYYDLSAPPAWSPQDWK